MTSPEKPQTPRRVEKQAELYKESKAIFDWSAVPAGSVEIKDDSFDRALQKILTPANFSTLSAKDREAARLTVSKQIAAIEAAAVHAGFDMGLALTGDTISFENGVLYLDIKKSGKQLYLKLDPSAASIKSGYTEIKPEAVGKSRRAWQSLKEAMGHGILTDILPALAGGDSKAASFENRTKIWGDNMGRTEDYKGTYEQNKAMVEYLKGEVAAGRTVIVAPIASAGPAAAGPKASTAQRAPAGVSALPKAAKGGVEQKVRKGKQKAAGTLGRQMPPHQPGEDALTEYNRAYPRPPKDDLDEALDKVGSLISKANALEEKSERLATLQAGAKRNRSLQGNTLRQLRGSLTETEQKAIEVEKEALKISAEINQLKKDLEAGATKRGKRPEELSRILKSLDETVGDLVEISSAAKDTFDWAERLLNPKAANEAHPDK